MAYIDKQLTVSDAQAVTATAVSTNAIDTGGSSPIRDVGVGDTLQMLFATTVAAAAAGAATVTFEIVQADDSALTSNVEVLAASGPIGKAALVAGYQLALALPRNTRRFIGARYTIGTGPLTAGSFTATLTTERDAASRYASGYASAY